MSEKPAMPEWAVEIREGMKDLGSGIAWLGFWICVGLIGFNSCSIPQFGSAVIEELKGKK